MAKVERLEARYPGFVFGDGRQCAYCGDPAQDRDHVFPVSFMTTTDRSVHRRLKELGPQTYSCKQCNAWLSNRYFDTFRDRCVAVYDTLINRAGDESAHWEEQELKRLGYGLQSFVRQHQARRAWYLMRADWWLSDDYFLNIESLLYEPFLTTTHPKYHNEYYRYFRDTISGINRCLDARQTRQRY